MEFVDRSMPVGDLEELWSRSVADLQSRIMSDSAAGIWLPNLQPVDYDDGKLTVAAPNAYQARYLESHVGGALSTSVSRIAGQEVSVQFIVLPSSGQERGDDRTPLPIRVPPPSRTSEFASSPLDPKYTFDNFVVGPSNRVAHAAAKNVAATPGTAYNPLFIYGGVGLGKTHLMQAIGHGVKAQHPGKEVVYISGEAFLQNVLYAIRENKMDAFRARFRKVDLWLVDDIQFIASREGTRTESEFFFTFNALYQEGRQIVISSDRPPKELHLIDDRLRSRFEMGLMADIAVPDPETRLAILQQRAEATDSTVPVEVLQYIADRVESNIRALEGALVRVIYTASIDGETVSLDLVKRCLEDYAVENGSKGVSIADIKSLVAERFGVAEADLSSKKRHKALVTPRQIAMYLARQHTELSLQHIASEFKRQDHTTVMHACTRTEDMISDDPSLASVVNEIADQLRRGPVGR
jgi:chromosomal replication initiator protein